METQAVYKCAAMRMPDPRHYTPLTMSAKYRADLIAALVYMENHTCENRDVPSEHVAIIKTFREELEGIRPDNRRIA